MAAKVRSSGMSGDKKSGRFSSSRRKERSYRKHTSRRTKSPRPFSDRSGKPASSARALHRLSPVRKAKPLPVNELDIVSLSEKEQQSRTGFFINKSRTERAHNRQRIGMTDKRGFWVMKNRMDYRRTPMYPQRRGIGGGDSAGQRTLYGRTSWQSYKNEESKKINEQEKPVMNLFDPCKVPTGRSYFTHDDRMAKPSRVSRSGNSSSGDKGWQSLPVGWRNVRKVRKNDNLIRGDSNHSSYDNNGGDKNPVDAMWKHDMFECAEDEPA
ncbi:unnamed protein product [Thelazia callipaeda]|uniref:Btz domain-containing protein n=1 Tax=Thelazia callipaeda TaxID=103827 RepID=A0A158RAZ8_THECL|nr:unnamed protein product [Thelazia callipaeda]